jgi:hypothetical protein
MTSGLSKSKIRSTLDTNTINHLSCLEDIGISRSLTIVLRGAKHTGIAVHTNHQHHPYYKFRYSFVSETYFEFWIVEPESFKKGSILVTCRVGVSDKVLARVSRKKVTAISTLIHSNLRNKPTAHSRIAIYIL